MDWEEEYWELFLAHVKVWQFVTARVLEESLEGKSD